MAPKSKVKGCFQCSKRRVVCDLGHPQCKKCLQKGLECSGLNRIRFVGGIASRGKFKNSQIPAAQTSKGDYALDLNAPHSAAPPRCPASASNFHDVRGNPDDVYTRWGGEIVVARAIEQQTNPTSVFQDIHSNISTAHPLTPRESYRLQPWLPPVGHHARMLMSHFSSAVAPVMVVIDSLGNGYREFILPLACQDELLQRTVGVVAAQHLSQSQPQLRNAAASGHKAIIDRLQRDATSGDSVFSMSTWVTLLVLLVGETIDPGPSFGPLIRMLLLTAENCNATSMPRDIYDFLSKQTHMFEVIARPQLNEREGIELLTQSLHNHLDWIPSARPLETEQTHAVNVSRQAFIEAFQLYLHRANGGSINSPSSVKKLRSLISSLDIQVDGAHALVWPCFVACIESVSMDDREFFLRRLTQIFDKTRFRNVQAAIESLPRIWYLEESQSWTSRLADILPVLIM